MTLTLTLTFIMERYQMSSEQIKANLKDWGTIEPFDCKELVSTYQIEAIKNLKFVTLYKDYYITFTHGYRKYKCTFSQEKSCCESTKTSVNGLPFLQPNYRLKRKSKMTYWNTQKKVVEIDSPPPFMTVRFQHFALNDGDTIGKIIADFCLGKRFNEDTIMYRFVHYNRHNGYYPHIFRIIADGKMEKGYCL